MKPGRGSTAGLPGQGDRVADLDFRDVLDAGDDVADFPGFQRVQRRGLRGVDPHFVDLVLGVVGEELDLVALFHDAVDDLDQDDHAAVGVEPGIEDQRLQGLAGVARRGRDALDDGRDDLVDADPGLGRDHQRLLARDAQDVLHLLQGLFQLVVRQVDLVHDRDQGQVVLHGQVGVGHGLGLHALAWNR